MKKLLAILAIAGSLTACNNGDGDKATTDTAAKTPTVDATKTADSANKMIDAAKDTATKMLDKAVDTAKKMVEKAGDKMLEKAKEAVKH